jgi:peptidoglycan/LPS O-acetylase OafA/YrhL
MGKTLAEASGGRANNTAFARFLLTSTVIYSHSFAVMWGSNICEPVAMVTRRQASAGGLAVEGFLILSGFLITRSWFFSRGATDFLIRRTLRIYPAFLVATVVGGTIAVPWLAICNPEPRPLAFWNDLVFPALLLKYTPLWSNGSLWILPFEFACYLIVTLFGMFGALSRRRLILLLWILNSCILVGQLRQDMFPSHSLMLARIFNNYLAGMVFFLYRDSIRLSRAGFVAAVLALTFCGATMASWCLLPHVSPLLWGYILLFLCYYPSGRLQSFAYYGDFSYGMFLYAFPAQLILAMYFRPWLHPLTLFLAAWPVAIVCGVLSWFAVERPFLRLKRSSSTAARPASVATALLAPSNSSAPESGAARSCRGFRMGAGAALLFKGPILPRSVQRSTSD